MPAFKDRTGEQVGRLTILSDWKREKKVTSWKCLCECGTEKWIRANHLTESHTRSCGCLMLDTNTSHNKSRSLEYKVWDSMIQRCGNKSHKAYDNYGGRGISVCSEWQDFENFYADMGDKEGLTLERLDNDKGYSKDNCKWVTMTDQARNRRTTKLDMTKAREIRRLASVGNVSKDIAKMFDVSYTNINHILKGETWREQYAS
jgi:hypothetical protein